MILYDTTEISSIEPPAAVTAHDRCDNEKLQIFQDALSNAGHRELRSIRVFLNRKAVKLRGTVSSFYLKQVAQEAIRPHAIGLKILNELVVASDPAR